MHSFCRFLFFLYLMVAHNFVVALEYCEDGRIKKRQKVEPSRGDSVYGPLVIDGATCSQYRIDVVRKELDFVVQTLGEVTTKINTYTTDPLDKKKMLELLSIPTMQKFLPAFLREKPLDTLDDKRGLSDILKIYESFQKEKEPMIRLTCNEGHPECKKDKTIDAFYETNDDYINFCAPFWCKPDSADVKCGPGKTLDDFESKARALNHELFHSDCWESRLDEPKDINVGKAYFTECCYFLANGEVWSKNPVYREMAARNADNGAWVVTGYHFDQLCNAAYPSGIPITPSKCARLANGPPPTSSGKLPQQTNVQVALPGDMEL